MDFPKIDESISHPIEIFSQWFNYAKENLSLLEPTAATLATVDSDGQPSCRVILIKEFSPEGFVFYTNYDSPKAQDIQNNKNIALLFYYDLGRQIRIQGTAKKVSDTISDKYFHSRPRASQIASSASLQSQPLNAYEDFSKRVSELESKYPDKIPRPENWGGYIIEPSRFEFWVRGEHRIHDRVVYQKKGDNWSKTRLYP